MSSRMTASTWGGEYIVEKCRSTERPAMLTCTMPTRVPSDPSQAALRWVIRRFVLFCVVAVAAIAAFVVAWRLGAFAP
jgi:hypothetical protein